MNDIQSILTSSVNDLIKHSSSDEKINSLEDKHNAKLHFIPYRYRIFGGILQSMNIQFGNFIEKVMDEVIRRNPALKVIDNYSGKKSNSFKMTVASESLIDSYITECQTNTFDNEEQLRNYNKLISNIKANESNLSLKTNTFKHDVDMLFQKRDSGVYYYVEIKYNDDHDTGKFVDINRKLLKTYAYLQRELGVEVQLKPILFYFNNKRMKGNIYLPEQQVIYRGKRFFDEFTTISYSEMDRYMKNISESPETVKLFDDLYKKIMNI